MQLAQHGILGFPNRGGYFVADDGTGDGLSQANPMSTADFITLSATLAVGDVVHFKRGDTFELGELTLNAANLTLSAYGTGDDPVITGSTSIAGLSWSNVGNVWSAAIGSAPKWIFKDGVASKWAQTDWLIVSSKPAADTVRVSAGSRTIINALPDSIVGAKFRVIEDAWIMSFEYTVIAYNSTNGDIQLDRSLAGTVAPNSLFALFDQEQFLTEANEWWYDSVNGDIYYYSTVNPNTLNIRASNYDEAFNLTADNITIDKLKITNYYFAAVNGGTAASNNARIQFCQIVHNKNYGIYAVDCDGYKILRNTIQFGNNGIARTGDSWLISHNTINSFGQDTNYPLPIGSYQSTGNGILLWGDNNVIRANTMSNFSYCGMLITGFNYLVERNTINDFCKLFEDGAGIYTAGVGTAGTTNSGGHIYKNHVSDGFLGSVSMGIYIDNHTTGYTIEENVIYNIPYFGVLCNWDTETTTVINNVFRNCLVSVKFRNDTTRSPLYANNINNVVTGNVFAEGIHSQRGIEIESYNGDGSFDPFSGTGSIDFNHYLFPYNLNSNIAQSRATANGAATSYTLAAWQTKTGDEANSNAIVNLYTYTTEENADDEVLLSINTTESTVVVGIGANYVDEEGTVTTSRTIPDFFAAVSISQVDRADLVFQDTFTGGAGNITGHTPELGSAWTVEFGTISLDGSGRVGASVTGEMYQTLGSSDVIIDATGRVTSTPFTLTILLRYTDINNWIGAQLFITTVAEDSRVILTNRVSGTSTQIQQVDPGTAVANTDYKVTATLIGNNIKIYIDDVLWLNYTDTLNANIGANNPTGVKHGLRVPTGVNYTLCEMYEL